MLLRIADREDRHDGPHQILVRRGDRSRAAPQPSRAQYPADVSNAINEANDKTRRGPAVGSELPMIWQSGFGPRFPNPFEPCDASPAIFGDTRQRGRSSIPSGPIGPGRSESLDLPTRVCRRLVAPRPCRPTTRLVQPTARRCAGLARRMPPGRRTACRRVPGPREF